MKAVWKFRTAAIYILETNNHNKSCIYFSKIYYHTLHKDSILTGASGAVDLQVRTAAMLLGLLIIGNEKVRRWYDLQRSAVHTRFRENRLIGSKVEGQNTWHGDLNN